MLSKIADEDEAKELLEGSAIIFKHSNTCPISANAWEEINNYVEDTGRDVHYVVVQENRSVSDLIQDETGVEHESPQVLVVEDGNVEWHASHREITNENVKMNTGEMF